MYECNVLHEVVQPDSGTTDRYLQSTGLFPRRWTSSRNLRSYYIFNTTKTYVNYSRIYTMMK